MEIRCRNSQDPYLSFGRHSSLRSLQDGSVNGTGEAKGFEADGGANEGGSGAGIGIWGGACRWEGNAQGAEGLRGVEGGAGGFVGGRGSLLEDAVEGHA
jgi:hypothetical protein